MKKITFLLLLSACAMYVHAQTPAQNKAKMTEFYAAFNGDMSKFKAANFVAADFVDHAIPAEAWSQMGPDGVARMQASLGMFKASFPDSQFKPSIIVADGEYAMAYGEQTGTFKSDFMGIAANNKTFKFNDVDIVKFNKEGKAVAHWSVQDASVMWMQLGIPPK